MSPFWWRFVFAVYPRTFVSFCVVDSLLSLITVFFSICKNLFETSSSVSGQIWAKITLKFVLIFFLSVVHNYICFTEYKKKIRIIKTQQEPFLTKMKNMALTIKVTLDTEGDSVFFLFVLRGSCREHARQPAVPPRIRLSLAGPLRLHHLRDHQWGMECGGPAKWFRCGPGFIRLSLSDRLLSWVIPMMPAFHSHNSY